MCISVILDPVLTVRWTFTFSMLERASACAWNMCIIHSDTCSCDIMSALRGERERGGEKSADMCSSFKWDNNFAKINLIGWEEQWTVIIWQCASMHLNIINAALNRGPMTGSGKSEIDWHSHTDTKKSDKIEMEACEHSGDSGAQRHAWQTHTHSQLCRRGAANRQWFMGSSSTIRVECAYASLSHINCMLCAIINDNVCQTTWAVENVCILFIIVAPFLLALSLWSRCMYPITQPSPTATLEPNQRPCEEKSMYLTIYQIKTIWVSALNRQQKRRSL